MDTVQVWMMVKGFHYHSFAVGLASNLQKDKEHYHRCSSMFLNVLLLSSLPDYPLVAYNGQGFSWSSPQPCSSASNPLSSLSTTWAVPEPFPESMPSFSGRMAIPVAAYGVKHRSCIPYQVKSPSQLWSCRWLGNAEADSGTHQIWLFVVSNHIGLELTQVDNSMRWTSDNPPDSIVNNWSFRYNLSTFCYQPINKHSLGISLKNRHILQVDA